MSSDIVRDKRSKLIRIFFFMLTVLIVMADDVCAHRVNVFAWVEGDTVYVESKFSGGRKVKHGNIIVTDSRGAELLTGKTNDQGEFSFKVPAKTELRIILEAGEGHRGEWTVPIEDIEDSAAGHTSMPAQTSQIKDTPRSIASGETQPPSPPESIPAPSVGEIEQIVEKALDKKLKPVIKMLAESQQKGPTGKDIFGGIGYIIGLVGLATYLRFRKKKQ